MQRLLETFSRYTGRAMEIDEAVYRSESETGHRNRAIAHLLYGYGVVERAPEEVLDLYFRQCSILVTARDLAMMGACLANNGVNPVTGVVALQSRYVQKVLSVMSTCGMYDYSGGWIFNVGMPAKSGVGGGIMAELPGQFGLGVFSPPLDAKGNSVRGIAACERLSSDFGLHLFQTARSTSASVIRQVNDCSQYPSRRRRNAVELQVLEAQGHRVRIYELQGELLFGSAESVVFDMLVDLPQCDCLVVDLKRVGAMDRASMHILGELCAHAAQQQKRLFFTDCEQLYRFRKHLQKKVTQRQEPDWLSFDDTDRAKEWCEDRLLAETGAAGLHPASAEDLGLQYLCSGMTPEELGTLRKLGEERRFSSGSRIFMAGAPADCLYFILSGEVEVSIATDSGRELRLTTLAGGMVVGEIGLLNQRQRTANVTAVTDTLCLEIGFAALPDAVRTKMLMNMASYFASRIERNTALIQHLA
jgi:glutaminase